MQIAYKIIKEISEKLEYIRLCASIMHPKKGGIGNKTVAEALKQLTQFICNAVEEEIILNGPTLLNSIEPIYLQSLKNFPPKKDLSIILQEANAYYESNPDYVNYGILYGWLNDLIDCTKLYKEPIPSHARVGVYMHAGKFAIEESMILRDAFYFISLAERELSVLNKIADVAKSKGVTQVDEEEYSIATTHNLNIGTFSRSALLNLYSFVEAFVNGVGLDHLYNNAAKLSQSDIEMLQGKKRNSYLSLEKKLELFHRIIRPDGRQLFSANDKAQRKEPFLSFFDECKEIRDSAVHFSALKAPIVRKPHDWVEKAQTYGRISLEVAKTFWTACYDSKKFPDYLDTLNYDILKSISNQRVLGNERLVQT